MSITEKPTAPDVVDLAPPTVRNGRRKVYDTVADGLRVPFTEVRLAESPDGDRQPARAPLRHQRSGQRPAVGLAAAAAGVDPRARRRRGVRRAHRASGATTAGRRCAGARPTSTFGRDATGGRCGPRPGRT